MEHETLEADVKKTILKRETLTHKGDYGRILIAAGNLGMCGAAILAAKGAYRSGAGVVSVAIPKDFFPVVHSGVWEAVLVDREIPLPKITEYSAMAIGPGMGQSPETREFLEEVLVSYKGPLVLDADALNILAGFQDYSALKEYQGPLILTPHSKEAQRLLHISTEEYSHMSRQDIAKTLARITGAIVVLKGWGTIIQDHRGIIRVNPTGNPGMATGGTGDVLTGVITALLGRGFSPYDAAVTGVYIHGLAGDFAANKIGMTGMMAGDLVESLPAAFMEIERGK